jgi:hypothetical protein
VRAAGAGQPPRVANEEDDRPGVPGSPERQITFLVAPRMAGEWDEAENDEVGEDLQWVMGRESRPSAAWEALVKQALSHGKAEEGERFS